MGRSIGGAHLGPCDLPQCQPGSSLDDLAWATRSRKPQPAVRTTMNRCGVNRIALSPTGWLRGIRFKLSRPSEAHDGVTT